MGVIRRTKQRDAIEHALRSTTDFQSAQQIHLLLLSQGNSLGLATVYRNLQALSDHNLVEIIRSETGEALYRLCETADHHHHLLCRDCGKTVDVADQEFEKWVQQVARRHRFRKVEHSVELFGQCSECAQLEDEA